LAKVTPVLSDILWLCTFYSGPGVFDFAYNCGLSPLPIFVLGLFSKF